VPALGDLEDLLELRLGLQEDRIGTSQLFVLPNPSGRNANYSYAEMLAVYRALARIASL